MSERRELEAILRESLGAGAARPGLRRRIRAGLDEEDRRRAGSGVIRRPFAALRHPIVLAACAAALLGLLLLPQASSRLSLPRLHPGADAGDLAAGAGAIRVRLDGVVVCFECAREGAPLSDQIACREPGHASGLRLADGVLWRLLPSPEAEDLLAPALRGRRVTITGDLNQAAGGLVVASYRPL